MNRLRTRWRLRPWVGNLLLAVGTTLVLLVVIDLVLDRTHWFGARRAYVRPDPLLRYRFQPNAKYWFWEENDHPITGHISPSGWRDRPRSLTPPSNVTRVALLGDSYVEAFQVEAESTFALRAEDDLNRLAQRQGSPEGFEFLNFGRSGFTQSEEWLVLLHDVSRFEPDLVALFFYPGNDIRDIHPETSDGPRPYFSLSADDELILDVGFRESRNYRLRRWLNPLQRRSALVSLVIERLVTARQARRILEQTQRRASVTTHISAYRSLATERPEPRYTNNYALNKRLIDRMIEYCHSKDIGFLLVCMPDAYRMQTRQRLLEIDSSFNPTFFTEDLRVMADSLNVAFLDLQEPFASASAGGASLQWVHWNYAGHGLVAHQLMQKVLELHPLSP